MSFTHYTNKGIFFDRDDTLIHDSNYMHKLDQLSYIDNVFPTLKSIQDLGYQIFIVSNQSGIGRGYFKIEDTHLFHEQMKKDFEGHGVKIKDIVFCPHTPEDKCDCRKPNPKLLLELCEKYKINPTLSFMVGDKKSDVEAGINAGMKSIGINCESELSISKIEEILKYI